jgi:hypothetical protein
VRGTAQSIDELFSPLRLFLLLLFLLCIVLPNLLAMFGHELFAEDDSEPGFFSFFFPSFSIEYEPIPIQPSTLYSN